MPEPCIRCHALPRADELGYCAHCFWAVRAEVEDGFYAMRDYLRRWSKFAAWCRARGIAFP